MFLENTATTIVLAVVTIASVVSSFAALLTASADMSGLPLAKWPRRRRLVAALILFTTGALTGTATYFITRPTPGEASTPIVTASPAELSGRAPQTILNITAEEASGPDQRREVLTEPVVIIWSTNGRVLADLEAIALPIARRNSYRISGTAQWSTREEPELQGLVTAEMFLNVTVAKNSGPLIDSFSLNSRGGGFTATDALHQSRQRIAVLLEKRLGAVRDDVGK